MPALCQWIYQGDFRLRPILYAGGVYLFSVEIRRKRLAGNYRLHQRENRCGLGKSRREWLLQWLLVLRHHRDCRAVHGVPEVPHQHRIQYRKHGDCIHLGQTGYFFLSEHLESGAVFAGEGNPWHIHQCQSVRLFGVAEDFGLYCDWSFAGDLPTGEYFHLLPQLQSAIQIHSPQTTHVQSFSRPRQILACLPPNPDFTKGTGHCLCGGRDVSDVFPELQQRRYLLADDRAFLLGLEAFRYVALTPVLYGIL